MHKVMLVEGKTYTLLTGKKFHVNVETVVSEKEFEIVKDNPKFKVVEDTPSNSEAQK